MKIFKILIAGVVGIVCGFLSTHAFNIGWINLLFWGVVGIALGWSFARYNDVRSVGLSYGFFMSLSFLLTGFNGASHKLFVFIIFSLGLSVIGALGGWLCVFLGNRLKR